MGNVWCLALPRSLYHIPKKVMLIFGESKCLILITGMWQEDAKLHSLDTCPGEGYLWQKGMTSNKFETRRWALHSLCEPCSSSLDTRPQCQDPRWEWGGAGVNMVGKQICDGDSLVHHATGIWTSPPPTLGFTGDLMDHESTILQAL